MNEVKISWEKANINYPERPEMSGFTKNAE